MTQVLIYWILALLFRVAGLVPARLLLGALPDRGYAAAGALGLLLTGYAAWMLAMLGLAAFGAPLVAACLVALIAAGLYTQRRDLGGLGGWLRARAGLVIGHELLFLGALAFMALVRSYQPDPWGTERPMDFAFFNSIQRSQSFPPADPWLAGYSINYYYLGYLLMGCVALLSGIEASAAYNLSLALIFALAAQGIAGIVLNLTAVAREFTMKVPVRPSPPTPLPQAGAGSARVGWVTQSEHDAAEVPDEIAPSPSPGTGEGTGERANPHPTAGTWPVALLAVVLVLLAGNFAPLLQVVSGTEMISALDGRDQWRAIANGLGPRAALPLDPPFAGHDFDGSTTIVPTDRWADFNSWRPSRALWDDTAAPGKPPYRKYAITEFPMFSFWLGDMHPHVMSLPFVLLAASLALATIVRPVVATRRWLHVLLAGLVLGGLYVINSWDFPTGLLLFIASLSFALPLTRSAWASALVRAAVVLVVAVGLYLPFHLTFRSPVGGQQPLIDLPILSTITRTLGVVYWDKTQWYEWLTLVGLPALPLVALTCALAYGAARREEMVLRPRLLLAVPATLALGLVFNFALLALVPLGLLALLAARARRDQPADAFALLVVALGCAVMVGVELVHIRDGFGDRMNTVFKFYYQIWLLWGTIAGYGVWRLVEMLRSKRALLVPLAVLYAALLVAALIFPYKTVGDALQNREPIGLRGNIPRDMVPGGRESIAWLRANAPAGSVLVEAAAAGPRDSYDEGGYGVGGVAASTGIPSVLGWPGHQAQWRAGDQQVLDGVEPRRLDIQTIYSTTDTEAARALLDKYSVDFVYIGSAERQFYPIEGLAKFATMGEPVFEAGDVTIYRIGG